MVYLLTGPPGSGKSAALSRFVVTLRARRPDVLVIAHFVGASRESASLRNLLQRLCFALQNDLGSRVAVPEEIPILITTFRDLLAQVPPNRRVVILPSPGTASEALDVASDVADAANGDAADDDAADDDAAEVEPDA